MNKQIIQSIGWCGVAAILVAYALINFGTVTPQSAWYLILNLTGSLAIALVAASKKDRQPMVLNIIWALIALATIFRIWVS